MPDQTLLLLQASAPPTPGGTSIVLHRLLGSLPDVRLAVVTDRGLRAAVRRHDELTLPGSYRFFPRLGGRAPFLPGARSAVDALNVPLSIAAGVSGALRFWRRRPDWVLSALDGAFSPVAGALAAALLRRPFVLLIFDLWEENAYGSVSRGLARLLEGPIMRRAAAVVVFSSQSAEHLERKHGVECTVIATPIEPVEPPFDDAVADERELLVAGAIYWAQEDAVRRLLRVCAQVPEVHVTMVGDEHALRARGLRADRYEPAVSGPEFAARARRAGTLFLGLSFGSEYEAVIRTATPARLAEYMATGRPLLVHAPPGSHVVEYARSEDFAEVVDRADDAALAAGVRRLLDEPALARARSERALALARERHDVRSVSGGFRALLDHLSL